MSFKFVNTKGLDPLVISEEFFMMDFLEPWGHLQVVLECVVSDMKIILNGLMTCAHISGSNPTPMSFNFFFFKKNMYSGK